MRASGSVAFTSSKSLPALRSKSSPGSARASGMRSAPRNRLRDITVIFCGFGFAAGEVAGAAARAATRVRAARSRRDVGMRSPYPRAATAGRRRSEPRRLGCCEPLEQLLALQLRRRTRHLRPQPLRESPRELPPRHVVDRPAALEELPYGCELLLRDRAHVPVLAAVAVRGGRPWRRWRSRHAARPA